MNHIRAILFDIDGTLLDTTEFILQATENTLRFHNLPVPEEIVMRRAVGLPSEKFFEAIVGYEVDAEKLIKTQNEFQKQNLHLSFPYTNTFSTLHSLKQKGFKIGAVTSRNRDSILQTLSPARIDELLDVLVADKETPLGKPHADPLFKAIFELQETPQTAIMIGDSHLDIEMGKNAGTKTVRAMYGFHTEFLHEPEPDFFVEDISDILKIV